MKNPPERIEDIPAFVDEVLPEADFPVWHAMANRMADRMEAAGYSKDSIIVFLLHSVLGAQWALAGKVFPQ